MSDITILNGIVTAPNAQVGTVGENRGVTLTPRLGLRVAQSQSLLQDAVERGNCYSVANQAGVTSQAGLSATTPVLTLANPLGSGVNLVMLYLAANLAVANAAAAALMIAVNTNVAAAAVTGTLTTAHRNLKLGIANAPKGIPFLSATLPAAPVSIGTLGMGLTGAITTLPGSLPYERWVNGGIILTPGTAISIQTSTASGASGLWCEYIWEEVAA